MNDPLIVDYIRTPISRSRPDQPEKDVYNATRADDLAGICINELPETQSWPAAGTYRGLLDRLRIPDRRELDGRRSARHPRCRAPVRRAGRVDRPPVRLVPDDRSNRRDGDHDRMADVVLAGGMEHITRVPMSVDSRFAINEKITFERSLRLDRRAEHGPHGRETLPRIGTGQGRHG